MGRTWIVTMGAGLIAATLHASAQQPTTAPQPTQQPPAPAPRREPGVFPAMQRPPADPAVVERGKGLFGVMCIACHGARG